MIAGFINRLNVAALILLAAGPALAQTAATGTIRGVVTDVTVGVLPGVTVVIRNQETNVSRDVVTDEQGRYQAPALQPGLYEVSATLDGFAPAKIADIQVQVGQSVAIDVEMKPATVSEEVTVTGESPVIDTRRTDVSNVIGQTAIENLPINGRRWENFVLLSPGVTNDGGFGLVSYRGISGLYNNNTVDGVDNNQAFFSEARGRTRVSYTISQSTIREFQVGISNFSAEFGRAAGGTVNAVTKTGTNQFRGEGFYFLRADEFQSRDPFFPPASEVANRPNERRQQFGVGVGGPIKKDKAFFYTNYDQQLREFPMFVRLSNSAFFSGPPACTAPGCAATRTFFEGLNQFVDREGNNRIFFGKTDVAVNSANNLSLQYNLHRWNAPNGIQTASVVTVSESANGRDVVKTDFFVATLNSVLGRRWLNEFRFQGGRDFEAQEPNGPGPSTTVTGGISFGMPNFLPRPSYPNEKRFQFVDSLSYFAGRHSFKGGVDINYVREELINLFQGGGVYSYPSFQAIASDCPLGASGCVPLADANTGRHYSSFTQAFDLRGLAGDVFFATTDYNFYVQDNWTVNNKLTLNLGLRYEYQKLPQPGEAEVNGIVFTGNPNFPATTRFHQDKNNWGPRLGFTYDVGGEHQTVVRGGYGLYFGRTSNSAVSNALTNNAVTFATYFFNNTTAGAPTYPNVLSGPPTGGANVPDIQFLSPDLERPEIHMADLSVDRAIGNDVTVSVSYLYSRGKKLPTFVDTNLNPPNAQVRYVLGTVSGTPPVFVPGSRVFGPFPFFRGARPDSRVGAAVELRSVVDSEYHGIVLQAQKRFSKGLLFNLNYTLAKAEDNGQNSTTFFASTSAQVNPFDLDAEKSASTFDRRHRFVASFHYAPEYLYGIQIGGVITAETGLPLDPTTSGNIATATGATRTTSLNGAGGDRRPPFVERNSFRQDGRRTFDLRFSKSFNVGGRKRLIVLWEMFNAFNTTNFTRFENVLYSVNSSSFDAEANTALVNLVEVPNFLVANQAATTIYGPRDQQLGFKFTW